ncbi:unnamed protein product [Diplocarpon coronariae]
MEERPFGVIEQQPDMECWVERKMERGGEEGDGNNRNANGTGNGRGNGNGNGNGNGSGESLASMAALTLELAFEPLRRERKLFAICLASCSPGKVALPTLAAAADRGLSHRTSRNQLSLSRGCEESVARDHTGLVALSRALAKLFISLSFAIRVRAEEGRRGGDNSLCVSKHPDIQIPLVLRRSAQQSLKGDRSSPFPRLRGRIPTGVPLHAIRPAINCAIKPTKNLPLQNTLSRIPFGIRQGCVVKARRSSTLPPDVSILAPGIHPSDRFTPSWLHGLTGTPQGSISLHLLTVNPTEASASHGPARKTMIRQYNELNR